jgi:CO dehydrogenase maturation factor
VRVAFTGKGGGGKSFIAATFARSLARAMTPVLALDIDTVPGLALSLGVQAGPEGLPEHLAEEKPGLGWVMREPIPAMDLVNRYSVEAPDGVRLLTLGKMPGHLKPSSSAVFRHVVRTFDEPAWSMVADLPAGVRQPSFGWAEFAEVVVIVVEPTAKSQITAQRVARIVATSRARAVVVMSKWRPGDDAEAVAAAIGLPLIGVVPYDDEVRAAESAGLAPLDAVPEAAAVKAVERLLGTLEDER